MNEGKNLGGRPPKGTKPRTYTLTEDVFSYLDNLPDGQRSDLVNSALQDWISRRSVCCMCDQPANLECKIGKCKPSKWYCSFHYAKEHTPE